MGRPLVEVNAVSRVFVSGAARHTALDDISFQVGEREFVALLGPSGCGKSTLLRLIADIIPPTSGRLTVAGGSPEAARRAGLFGFVFQESVLFPWLTALANVELPLKVGRPRGPGTHASCSVGRARRLRRVLSPPVSGGMRQRVALARALVTNSQLLLMDEPFAALDEITREAMGNWLLTVWEQTGKTVLFVTHSVPEAVYLADRVVVLSPAPGRIEAVLPIALPRPRQPDSSRTHFRSSSRRPRSGGDSRSARTSPLASSEIPPRWTRVAWDWLLPAGVIAGLVLVWEVLGRVFDMPDYIVPLPSVIGAELMKKGGMILSNLWITLLEALGGFLLGNVVALALAIVSI